jgi:hypothetical protein
VSEPYFFFWCPSSLRIKRTETDGKRKKEKRREELKLMDGRGR